MANPKNEGEADTSDFGTIEKRLKSIVDYVADCERRVIQGEILDLKGLDKNVIEICEAIANLPGEQSRTLEAVMARLIDGLETLARAMKDQQDKFVASGRR